MATFTPNFEQKVLVDLSTLVEQIVALRQQMDHANKRSSEMWRIINDHSEYIAGHIKDSGHGFARIEAIEKTLDEHRTIINQWRGQLRAWIAIVVLLSSGIGSMIQIVFEIFSKR